MQGLIPLRDRPGDFVFLVSFGRSQSHHEFDESITDDGVLSWQSQPSQRLRDPPATRPHYDRRIEGVGTRSRVRARARERE